MVLIFHKTDGLHLLTSHCTTLNVFSLICGQWWQTELMKILGHVRSRSFPAHSLRWRETWGQLLAKVFSFDSNLLVRKEYYMSSYQVSCLYLGSLLASALFQDSSRSRQARFLSPTASEHGHLKRLCTTPFLKELYHSLGRFLPFSIVQFGLAAWTEDHCHSRKNLVKLCLVRLLWMSKHKCRAHVSWFKWFIGNCWTNVCSLFISVTKRWFELLHFCFVLLSIHPSIFLHLSRVGSWCYC